MGRIEVVGSMLSCSWWTSAHCHVPCPLALASAVVYGLLKSGLLSEKRGGKEIDREREGRKRKKERKVNITEL